MAYKYIERLYGKTFTPKQRVTFTEDGRQGVVMRPQGDPQYVRVRFDGGHIGNCHPLSVEPAPAKDL